MDVNDLWNYFKNSTIDSIKKNIPTKSNGNKTTYFLVIKSNEPRVNGHREIV
jgi:hypothetical protein